jgi:hypothetical protein
MTGMRTWLRSSGLMVGILLGLAQPAAAQFTIWDFDSDDGFWSQSTGSGSAFWYWDAPSGTWRIDGSSNVSDAWLLSPVMQATSIVGSVFIWHRFDFEDNGSCFDGGNASYRINGGAWTPLDMLLGGHNGTVAPFTSNPLAGQDAWCGNSGGTQFSFAAGFINPGDTYQLGFHGGWDFSIDESGPDWKIDKVKVFGFEGYDVPNTTVPEPSTVALLATGLVGMGIAARRRKKQ